MSLEIHEWPSPIIQHMSSGIIELAKTVRHKTGMPMIPSPDPEAHARAKDGTSLHDIGVDKKALSKATDCFLLDNKKLSSFWLEAQTVPSLGGFGLYFDTLLNKKQVVLAHMDTRVGRMMWLCPSRDRAASPRTYIYFHKDPVKYLRILADELEQLCG